MSNVLQITWHESTFNDGPSLAGFDSFGKNVLEVYPCEDGSWRVWFEHGTSTKECDTKQRNLRSLEEAKAVAERWYREWALDWLPQ